MTGVVVMFEEAVPENVPDVKLTVDWLLICAGIGMVIFTSKVTVAAAPGVRVPTEMPSDGTADGRDTPLTITL